MFDPNGQRVVVDKAPLQAEHTVREELAEAPRLLSEIEHHLFPPSHPPHILITSLA
jgi:hypothetical protein